MLGHFSKLLGDTSSISTLTTLRENNNVSPDLPVLSPISEPWLQKSKWWVDSVDSSLSSPNLMCAFSTESRKRQLKGYAWMRDDSPCLCHPWCDGGWGHVQHAKLHQISRPELYSIVQQCVTIPNTHTIPCNVDACVLLRYHGIPSDFVGSTYQAMSLSPGPWPFVGTMPRPTTHTEYQWTHHFDMPQHMSHLVPRSSASNIDSQLTVVVLYCVICFTQIFHGLRATKQRLWLILLTIGQDRNIFHVVRVLACAACLNFEFL